MKKVLEVKFGSMYTTSGKLQMIDNIGFVFSKETGVLKWGSMDGLGGESTVRDYYNKRLQAYKDGGLEKEANDLVLLEFDRYDGVLSIEEICVLSNYIILSCTSYKTIESLMYLDEASLHSEVKALQSFGY